MNIFKYILSINLFKRNPKSDLFGLISKAGIDKSWYLSWPPPGQCQLTTSTEAELEETETQRLSDSSRNYPCQARVGASLLQENYSFHKSFSWCPCVGMMTHVWNPSIWETEAKDQEFKASLCCIARMKIVSTLSLQNKTNPTTKYKLEAIPTTNNSTNRI